MAAKVDTVVEIVRRSLRAGKSCVIGLQSTGESQMQSIGEAESNASEDLDDLASSCQKTMEDFLNNHCSGLPRRKEFLQKVKDLNLPPNPLDDIMDRLGGPRRVAEMTGRAKRFEKNAQGEWEYVKRIKGSDELSLNIEERVNFQSGNKRIAIISEAASSGISLQADNRVKNTQKRVHITLQLAWSADQAVQQMGRTHRSNQRFSPEFELVMTPIGGEYRSASAVASRLQALGALTRGDRRAGGTSSGTVQSYAIDSKYGNDALRFLLEVIFSEQPLRATSVPEFVQESYGGDWSHFVFEAAKAMRNAGLDANDIWNQQISRAFRKEKDIKLKTFLNRLLGIPLKLQNEIFGLFTSLMEDLIAKAKSEGKYQEGIVDMAGDKLEIARKECIYECPRTQAETRHVVIRTDRGVSWDCAQKLLEAHLLSAKEKKVEDKKSGFYRSDHDSSTVFLALQRLQPGANTQFARQYFHTVSPHTGHAPQLRNSKDIRENASRISETGLKGCEKDWSRRYNHFKENCGHGSNCSNPGTCKFKKRTQEYHLITGLILPFWNRIQSHVNKRVRVVRVQPTDGSQRIVGLQIPHHHIQAVVAAIRQGQKLGHETGDREKRIVQDPFCEVLQTLVVHDCVSPHGRERVKFDLPEGWRRGPNSQHVSCVARIFEIPMVNGLDAEQVEMVPASWRAEDQLYYIDPYGLEETIPVPTNVRKQGLVARSVFLDGCVKTGDNKIAVNNIGERFSIMVQLVNRKSVEDVRAKICRGSKEGLSWGKELLAKAVQGDEDIMMDTVDVSLKCPWALCRMSTPARGTNCDHLACFELDSFLKMVERHCKWICPVCENSLRPEEVSVCSFTLLMLKKVPGDLYTVNNDCTVAGVDTMEEWEAPIIDEIGQDRCHAARSQDQDDVTDRASGEQTGDEVPFWLKDYVESGLWEYIEGAEDSYVAPQEKKSQSRGNLVSPPGSFGTQTKVGKQKNSSACKPRDGKENSNPEDEDEPSSDVQAALEAVTKGNLLLNEEAACQSQQVMQTSGGTTPKAKRPKCGDSSDSDESDDLAEIGIFSSKKKAAKI